METSYTYTPLISIVIPVYNGSNYLKEAIDSALNQTYKSIEIIVVNDGSKDDTEQIAKSYGNKIRYFSKENGGTSTALNVGIRHMKGSYFSWLSHDDLYYPNKIERQVEYLNSVENRDVILLSELDGINEKYEYIYATRYCDYITSYPSRLKSRIFPVLYMKLHGCTLLIPRKCFDEVGLFDESSLVAQDFEFFSRLFLKYPYHYLPDFLVTARDHSVRQGIRSRAKGSEEYSKLFISIIESLNKEEILNLAPTVLDFYSDMLNMFKNAGYLEGVEYMNRKIVKNVHINFSDLVGHKYNGHDLHFFLRREGVESSQLVYKKESSDPATFVWTDSRYMARIDPAIREIEQRNSFQSMSSPYPYEILKNRKFLEADIVHYHILHDSAFNISLLPLLTRLKPSVWSLHDPWVITGHCIHPFDCGRYEIGCGDCPDIAIPNAMAYDNSALNFAMKKEIVQRSEVSLVVASEWMRKKVAISPITANHPIHLIPYGIDQTLFIDTEKRQAKRLLGLAEGKIVIMLRASRSIFKGMEYIEAGLRALRPYRDRVSIITVDEKGLLAGFKNDYKLLEYGWLNDDAMLSKLYQASDLLLMPSLAESFGMMAIEAMSCGCVVLSIDGTALKDVINSPECGVATPRTTDAYAKELIRLLNNPAELNWRREASLSFARQSYSMDLYLSRILKVYDETINIHKLANEDRYVLEQLKENAQVEPPLWGPGVATKKNLSMNIKRVIKKVVPRLYREMIKRLVRNVARTIMHPKKIKRIPRRYNSNRYC